MSPREVDNQEWEEIRSRIDSLAGAVFVLSGGALSISIGLVFGHTELLSREPTAGAVLVWAWWLLVSPIIAFVLLKVNVIVQKYILLDHPKKHASVRPVTNGISWLFGVTGVLCFCGGMVCLVVVAQLLAGV
ncbi:hypothetical protein [Arhodomonas aquaeolei]|uniref:hypothetical protein n=1 Tax=Arhodomonas aquaeolei TaxID=2369 RepID=UPI0012EC88C0|nr:hypothetical protein [Arhodomonas aquaeolei]